MQSMTKAKNTVKAKAAHSVFGTKVNKLYIFVGSNVSSLAAFNNQILAWNYFLVLFQSIHLGSTEIIVCGESVFNSFESFLLIQSNTLSYSVLDVFYV